MTASGAFSSLRTCAVVGSALAVANVLPSVACLTPLRRRLLPRLAGVSRSHHIALTFDDGPDRRTTPLFLDLLADHGVTATFFLLGAHAEREPQLVHEMASAGHELAVHGWDHDCLALRRPGGLGAELQRARAVIQDAGGTEVRWYRPPYGVLTLEGLYAARQARLETVLWSSWGVDWSRRATATSIVDTVSRSLVPGGTVLLHDTDRTAASGSWRGTLEATAVLLERWVGSEVLVGPLGEHW